MKKQITNQTISVIKGKVNLLLIVVSFFMGITKSFSNDGCTTPVCSITGNLIICGDGSTELCAPSGFTYLWPGVAVNAANPGEGADATSMCIIVSSAGDYTVIVSNGGGCTSSCTVTVTAVPDPDCTISGDLSICTGESTEICAPSGQFEYSWSTNETTDCITVTEFGYYSVTVLDNNGCSSTCEEFVSVFDPPTVDAGEEAFIDCNTPSVTLHATTPTIGKGSLPVISWTTQDGNIISGDNTLDPTVNAPGTYTITVTNPFTGCTASDDVTVTGVASTCEVCNQTTIIVNQNVTVNFNTNPPTYTGDPDLLPFFTYDNSGATPDLWKANFNLGSNKLYIKNGTTIKTSTVSNYAPGMTFSGLCDFELDINAHIKVIGNKKNAGEIIIHFNGDVLLNGEVRNEVTGTTGCLPGDITISSECGNVVQGSTGIVQSIGEDDGGSDISIYACGAGCNEEQGSTGNINIIGLVKAYAEASHGNQDLNRPTVTVVSLNGNVYVSASTKEPLYDEFVNHSEKYDLWGGLLSWVDHDAKAGWVHVQARHNVVVAGHGTDPTGPVRRSFGAIAAVGTSGTKTLGGVVDVRAIEGTIYGSDRSFDVSGKNRLFPNVARINLYAFSDISLYRIGNNNNFNPIVDARSPVSGGRGGTNDIRSFNGKIYIGPTARVYASVPSGGGTIQGVNLLEACTGVFNVTNATPADGNLANNFGSCGGSPEAIYVECPGFEIIHPESPAKIANSNVQNLVESVNVFPNPTDGNLTLQFTSSTSSKYTVRIVSITGAQILNNEIISTEGINQYQMDLSDVSKGMYILIVEGENLKQQRRITIQ